MTEKKAYTPTEFAEFFGREKTWTYRQLYAGKIDAITDFGRIMIPANQIARIEGQATRYLGKKKTAKTQVSQKPDSALSKGTTKRTSGLNSLVADRKKGLVRQKGMGRGAKRV